MTEPEEDPAEVSGAGGRFPLVQPGRDPQSNWEVDLASSLEEYLLRICSGEASQGEISSVNFAEAALLLQGSVQVYSRKVEYLYTLVLHALEFLSHKRQDEMNSNSAPAEKQERNKIQDGEDETFLHLDDIPVDPKNTLDDRRERDASLKKPVSPPANLLILEGDCLDNGGDLGELDSYLLSSCNYYGDFLLLDPCDAPAVYKYMQGLNAGKEDKPSRRGTSASSKSKHSTFVSPAGRSGQRSSIGKNQQKNSDQPLGESRDFDINDNSHWSNEHVDHDFHEAGFYHSDEPMAGGVDSVSDDEYEDPWKSLNPHELGTLKVKPFQKVRPFSRRLSRTSKRSSLHSDIPVAKLDNLMSPHLENHAVSGSPSMFAKLRRSFDEVGEKVNLSKLDSPADDNDYNIGNANSQDDPTDDPDIFYDSYDMNMNFPIEADGQTQYGGVDNVPLDNIDACESLEDLCHRHLDDLLASIEEAEKQTDLDARVSTWKERVDYALEEQDSHAPFDIISYGERIMGKLTTQQNSKESKSFGYIVNGEPKHEVARTFSALLQLVNNGSVDLETNQSNQVTCHTSTNPFHIRVLSHPQNDTVPTYMRKRAQSPSKMDCSKDSSLPRDTPKQRQRKNGKVSVKLAQSSPIGGTPVGKRRRRGAV